MKMLITFAMLLFNIIAAPSQNSKYHASMERFIKMMNECTSLDDYESTIINFERISKSEANEWLPAYYQAYCYSRMTLFEKDIKQKDGYLDRGLEQMEKAEKIAGENSEIKVMQAMLLGLKIGIDPAIRAREFGMRSGMYLQNALNLDPENPRVYLMLGQNALYTPEQYGGGKDKATDALEKSLELFKKIKPANSIMPSWGQQRAELLLEECKRLD